MSRKFKKQYMKSRSTHKKKREIEKLISNRVRDIRNKIIPFLWTIIDTNIGIGKRYIKYILKNPTSRFIILDLKTQTRLNPYVWEGSISEIEQFVERYWNLKAFF